MNRGLYFSLALLATISLAGCGGGGGGSHGSKGRGVLSLTILGDIGSGSGPVGNSSKIVVYRSDGSQVDETTVDLSSGTMQKTLTGLPSGTLRLHVGLSQTAGGAEVGSVDTTFEGGTAPAPMTFSMRKAVTSVVMAPKTATVRTGLSTELYAAAKAADDSYVFLAPGAIAWSSQNLAVATVDGQGSATGVSEGTATIRATHVATGFADTATLGVSATGARRGKWTVMVFMNASNDLYPFATQNMNQMEKIATNPDVRFVVQWKQVRNVGGNSSPLFSGTRRYLATHDNGSSIASTLIEDQGSGVDMGSPGALADFVEWTKARYPADHYALVLWNHGAGWNTPRSIRPPSRGISYDQETGNHMDPWDVASALTGQRMDILAYDACVMQGAEDLMELSDKADYIVGSEESTPGPGYPYHKVFKAFVDSPDTASRTLAQSLVTEFLSYYSKGDYASWPLHQSVLDTSKISGFRTALNNFGVAMHDHGGDLVVDNGVSKALTTYIRSKSIPMVDYTYYDLEGIASLAADKSSNITVVSSANALQTSLSDLVVFSQANSAGSHMKGITVEFERSGAFANDADLYAQLKLSTLTSWDEFLSSTTANP